MRNEFTRHHMLWERKNYSSPLEKRTRGLFIIPAKESHHRLLHMMLAPYEKPDTGTLLDLRSLRNPESVIEELDHPIAEHFAQQLGILAMSDEMVLYKLEHKDYTLGQKV